MIAFALAAVTMLPSGTYRFAVHSEGKVTMTSSVTIAHDGASVAVTETLNVKDGSETTTTRTLDPATFSTLTWAWRASDMSDGMTVTPAGATYNHDRKVTRATAPAAGPSAVFDFFVGEFAVLPAMLAMTKATHYNEYCACIGGFQAKSIAVVPSTAARPAGVPVTDEAITLKSEPAPDAETATLWYDPQTYILRELDFSKEKISYVRI